MARDLTTDFKNALVADVVRPAFLFDGVLGSQHVYIWTGMGDLSWDSKTWLGNGWLFGSSGVVETDDMATNGMDVMLAGVPQDILSLAFNQAQQGAQGKLYLALFGADGAIIGAALLYDGKFDLAEITESAETPEISLSYENHYIDLERPREFRYNPESQKIYYPDDTGFRYTPKLGDQHIHFGFTKKSKEKKTRKKVSERRGNRQRGGRR